MFDSFSVCLHGSWWICNRTSFECRAKVSRLRGSHRKSLHRQEVHRISRENRTKDITFSTKPSRCLSSYPFCLSDYVLIVFCFPTAARRVRRFFYNFFKFIFPHTHLLLTQAGRTRVEEHAGVCVPGSHCQILILLRNLAQARCEHPIGVTQ